MPSKGISITKASVIAAFREAGFSAVEITISESQSRDTRGLQVFYKLPDGITGILKPKHGVLPDERRARVAKIRGDVANARRALSR